MNLQQKIGEAVRALRRLHGVSQEMLAIDSCIDRRYLSDIENGRRNISVDVVERLASYFGLSPAGFMAYADGFGSKPKDVGALKDYLVDLGYEDAIVFDSPSYIDAVIGVSEEGRVVYSYSAMVAFLVSNDGMSAQDAAEFIDYNTVRALPYMGAKAPIIIYDIDL